MIKDGSVVKVHYTGRLEDGTEFDSSLQREPLEFTLGKGELIRGFERAVSEMSVGEKKTIKIVPEDGYGPVHENMIVTVPKSNVPQDVQVGAQLQADGGGSPITFVVRQINEDSVILDANHPLAGKTILFELEIVGVN